MAFYENGRPEFLFTDGPKTGVSSVVSSADGHLYVGGLESELAATSPERHIWSAKRQLLDADLDLATSRTLLPASVFQTVKETAERRLDETLSEAVIAVPDRLSIRRWQVLRNAAQVAGFDDIHPMDETTAAALAYGYDDSSDRLILVVDVGASTFSTSIIDIGGGVYEVLASTGDLHLGGDDWDETIVQWLLDRFDIDHEGDAGRRARLRQHAEIAKIKLSSRQATEITVPEDLTGSSGTRDVRLTRSTLEKLTAPLANRITDQLRRVCSDAAVTQADIDDIVLVGGATRIPHVRTTIGEFLGWKPTRTVSPDTAVADGAAIQGAVYSGHDDQTAALRSHASSIGIESADGSLDRLIEQDRIFPTRETKRITTSVDDQSRINLDVFQGPHETATENDQVGSFTVTGIPAAQAGDPRVELCLSIDEFGWLDISAEETALDEFATLTVEGKVGLTDEQLVALREELSTRVRDTAPTVASEGTGADQVSTTEQSGQSDTVKTEPEQTEREDTETPRTEPPTERVASPPRWSLDVTDIERGDLLGSGGQAEVHEVLIPGDGSPSRVALKEPRQTGKTVDSDVVSSFLTEAETWEFLDTRERTKSRWRHSEHIVGVVASGEDLPWIALEYMDGGTLADRLAEHPDGLPIDEALWIGESVCRGVELAHNYGIAHLDLKPANILFRATGPETFDQPKLADWGISRTLTEESTDVDGLTIDHAAPEQFRPAEFGDSDMLTDIYQVGSLLYTICVGNPPHTGTQTEVIQAVTGDQRPDPPSARRPALPAAIDRTIETAMARKKGERHRSIGVLTNEIAAIRSEWTDSA
jgi:molecular chaperone DnaK